MFRRSINVLVVIFAIQTLCPFLFAQKDKPQQVSVVQLVANPDRFNGKTVEVVGFFDPDWEGDSLYLNQEAYLNVIIADSLWLDKVWEAPGYVKESMDLKYIKIVGIFRVGDRGRVTGRVGGITDIKM